MVLFCHVISQDNVIKGSSDFMSRSQLRDRKKGKFIKLVKSIKSIKQVTILLSLLYPLW